MSLNINQNTNDTSYRYKMEKINTTQTGRGGNCHTILENISNISKQLNTVPDILVNYIGNVLGCNTIKTQVKNDNNINNINIYNLKGHYSNEKIQDIIYNFIVFATLCTKCNIPELSPEIIGKGKISILNMKCSACGKSYELVGNNKYNLKLVESMIKYYTLNTFVAEKGIMVSALKTDTNHNLSEFNPF
jgi:translation initiation factor 2 beta subunit (eIF-2beta)/eIF-5